MLPVHSEGSADLTEVVLYEPDFLEERVVEARLVAGDVFDLGKRDDPFFDPVSIQTRRFEDDLLSQNGVHCGNNRIFLIPEFDFEHAPGARADQDIAENLHFCFHVCMGRIGNQG